MESKKKMFYWPGLDELCSLLTNRGSFLRNTPTSVKTERKPFMKSILNTGKPYTRETIFLCLWSQNVRSQTDHFLKTRLEETYGKVQ